MRTIEVNVLSKKSINKAIKELREYQKEIRNEKLHKFMDVLGDKMADRIDSRFKAVPYNRINEGGYDGTVASFDTANGADEGILITASGDAIAFIEFGAGAEAYPGLYPYEKGDSNEFTPGSWSIEHGRTYQHWEESGYPGMYIFEQPGARAFDTAISELPHMVKEAFDEVFK